MKYELYFYFLFKVIKFDERSLGESSKVVVKVGGGGWRYVFLFFKRSRFFFVVLGLAYVLGLVFWLLIEVFLECSLVIFYGI